MNKPGKDFLQLKSYSCTAIIPFSNLVLITYNANLPQFQQSSLNILDVWEGFVQIRLEDITAEGVALSDGTGNPAETEESLFSEYDCLYCWF